MHILVGAKAVIQNASDQVLMLRRSQTDPGRPGDWDLPGGGIEEGEQIASGLAREIQEEAGLIVRESELRLLYAATEPIVADGESVTRLLFAIRVEHYDVQLSFEHDQHKWVSVATAIKDYPHPFYGVGLKYASDNKLI